MVAKCQCEADHCPHHKDKPCPNPATRRVSPSYDMCGECAQHYQEYMQGAAPRPKMGGVALNKTIYSRWDITTLAEGKAHVRYETNDNDDDGHPDGEVATWEKDVKIDVARDVTGVSRIGYYGQAVDVYLDGKKI